MEGGPEGRSAGRFRNLTEPLQDGARIAAFVLAVTAHNAHLTVELHKLNGQLAIVLTSRTRHLLGIAELPLRVYHGEDGFQCSAGLS